MFKKSDTFCPDCGHKMFITYNPQIHKKIYRCIYYPKCKGMALAASYGVIPGDRATREARYVAHKELEAFFKNKRHQFNFVAIYGKRPHIGQMNTKEIARLMQQFYSFKKDPLRLYVWNELKDYI